MDESSQKKFVLYIAQSRRNHDEFCPGSKAAIEAAHAAQSSVLVQNVDVMIERGVELPPWLDGTPILVNTEARQALKGSAAIAYLRELAEGAQEPERAPTMDQMHGVLPGGERLLHSEDSNFEPQPTEEAKYMNRENKVTESDLEAYLAFRNKSAPAEPRVLT